MIIEYCVPSSQVSNDELSMWNRLLFSTHSFYQHNTYAYHSRALNAKFPVPPPRGNFDTHTRWGYYPVNIFTITRSSLGLRFTLVWSLLFECLKYKLTLPGKSFTDPDSSSVIPVLGVINFHRHFDWNALFYILNTCMPPLLLKKTSSAWRPIFILKQRRQRKKMSELPD